MRVRRRVPLSRPPGSGRGAAAVVVRQVEAEVRSTGVMKLGAAGRFSSCSRVTTARFDRCSGCENERGFGGHQDGVLGVSGVASVLSLDRPPVAGCTNSAAASGDDRLDRDHGTLRGRLIEPGSVVVGDIGLLMDTTAVDGAAERPFWFVKPDGACAVGCKAVALARPRPLAASADNL